MLPGHRKFSDADVEEVVNDSLDVFERVADTRPIPDGLAPSVFGMIHQMVSTREIPVSGDILEGLGGDFRGH